MARSIVVYGPPGCGKTRNAKALRAALGMKCIVDDWFYGQSRPYPREDALLLTNCKPPASYRGPVFTYDTAMRMTDLP